MSQENQVCKKVWVTPKLVKFGSVAAVTAGRAQKCVPKSLGTGDDFTAILSTRPGACTPNHNLGMLRIKPK